MQAALVMTVILRNTASCHTAATTKGVIKMENYNDIIMSLEYFLAEKPTLE